MRDTVITLYKNVPIQGTTGDTLYFETISEQNSYFATKSVGSFNGCCYQRENKNTVRVPRNISGIENVNYLSFINTSYENKRYYAFVDEVNYINDHVTELVYSIDYLQTWLPNIINASQTCFVERTHTFYDTNNYTMTDSLDLGEVVTNSQYTDFNDILFNNLVVVFQATFDIETWVRGGFNETDKQLPKFMYRNGLADNTSLCFMRYSMGESLADSGSALPTFLYHINNQGSGVTYDDFLNIWIYPSALLYSNNYVELGTSTLSSEYNKIYFECAPNYSVWKPTNKTPSLFKLDNYTPHNKKLLSSPYVNLLCTNNNGSAVSYNPQKFSNDEVIFAFLGETTPSARVRFVPLNYKNNNSYDSTTNTIDFSKVDFDEALDLQMPSLQLCGSSYEIWLAQNRHQVQNEFDNYYSQALKDFLNLSSSAMENPVSGVLSPYNYYYDTRDKIRSSMAQKEDLKLRPATAKGVQSDGMAKQYGKLGVTYYVKSIDNNHAQSIDSFYSMFGYPVKTVRELDFKTRENYTYIKTIGYTPNFSLPSKDKNILSQMFDSGIRFWVNPSNVGNYGVTNEPLT